MQSSGAGKALFADVLAHPDDDVPRLRYADWLSQQGDVQGEFIHLSIDLTRKRITATDLSRWEVLARQHSDGWTAPLKPFADVVLLERGLPAHVKLDATRYLDHAHQIFALAPVRHADLKNAKAVFSRLCQSDALARLRSLDLARNDLDDNDISTLAASQKLPEMRWLNLILNKFGVPGIEALASSPNIPNLVFAGLGGNLFPDPVDHDSVDWDGHVHETPAPAFQQMLEQKFGRKAWLHPVTDAPDRYTV
ncbi:MAG: hypothetical protein JWN40_2334 [Phycisphaerales bacterium]|jgi:uncharacterized protein (TIGR02996 family)|nr:hypothetical protein [Phycisphaerales bacterium]